MNEQQRLLNAIWNEPTNGELEHAFGHEFESKGLAIYQRNLLANAKRALEISFPTVFSLLDSDVGESLTASFLRFSAPSQGDWGQWGESFSSFLSTTKTSDDYAYIADCALLDWHVHRALHGKDQSLEQVSLQRLSDTEPEHIFVVFNQNVKLLRSEFPITDIYQAHHHEDESQRDLAMINAKKALLSGVNQQAMIIYRQGFQPKVKNISDSEHRFMCCLLLGQSLAKALELVSNDEGFSFEQWLIAAIEQNLIHYFKEK